jgi:hypothetical protein
MYLIHPQHPSLQLAQVLANSGYWIWAEGGSLSGRWVGQFPNGASRHGLVLLVDTSLWIEVFRKSSRLDLRAVVDLDKS